MPDSTTTPQRRRIIFAESIWMDCITFTTLVAQLLGDTPAHAPDFAHLSRFEHGVKARRGQRRKVAHTGASLDGWLESLQSADLAM